jgi:hypothetical protein
MDVAQYGQTWQSLPKQGQHISPNPSMAAGTKEYTEIMEKINFNVIQSIKTEVISVAQSSENSTELCLVHANAQPDSKIYITIKASSEAMIRAFVDKFKEERSKHSLF